MVDVLATEWHWDVWRVVLLAGIVTWDVRAGFSVCLDVTTGL
jgi:hypothetical protein